LLTMGMGKRKTEVVEEVAEVDAEKKLAKKAKKKAAAVEEPQAEDVDAEAEALAAKKAAKRAKKAAAAAAAAAEEAEPAVEEEEDAAAAKAARKAAKKAKKAAAAAAEGEDVTTADAAPQPKEKEPETKPNSEKVEVAKPAAAEDEEWKDNTYKCCDCSEDWVDTADDQQFRWEKGFAETPKRCKDCRWAKKVRMEGGDPSAKGKGKKGKAGGDENTVFVRNLPFSVTEESLTKDFAECGEIVSLRLPMNDEGSPKGFAFIAYSNKEAMDKALAYNETDYGGRNISVTDASIKPESKGKDGKGKGKDGKGKDGKGKGKGKGKKGKAPSESFAKSTGAMVESTGKKTAFADSDEE